MPVYVNELCSHQLSFTNQICFQNARSKIYYGQMCVC